MEAAGLLDVAREGLFLLVLLIAPPVGAAVAAGLIVSLIQTATQVQEQTVAFAARAAAVVIALVVAGPWIGAQLVQFTQTVFQLTASVGAAP